MRHRDVEATILREKSRQGVAREIRKGEKLGAIISRMGGA